MRSKLSFLPFLLLALPLAACAPEEIERTIAVLQNNPTPEQIEAAHAAALAGGVDPAIIASVSMALVSSSEEPVPVVVVAAVVPPPEPEPIPRYTTLDPAGGPMGEEIATGVDCYPIFRIRICQ